MGSDYEGSEGESEAESEEEEAGSEDAASEGEAEEPQPSAEQLEERRQANIRALVSGAVAVARAPLLPRLLTVQKGAAVLRRPFKSPHPDAPAVSEALRRRLVARKQFVPWGANGSKFVPLKITLPARLDGEGGGQADAAVALPPGVEPLVLWEPPPGTEGGGPVRVDDMLTQWLRPHQREGVQFMFECVCGLRGFEGQGCILADDMGLGKTLQGITLLWTLLKDGQPLLGGQPIARRVIICCPTSLVGNWDSECGKWLKGRVRTLPLCKSSRDDVLCSIAQFLSPRNPFQVLIVSYETFRIHAERFSAPGSCDLLICDEAHRLKNGETLTNRALGALPCRRRVLLSGTPLQNDLQEFFAMVNFCNPGVLGSPSQFRRHYESPILAGREPGASEEVRELGQARSQELSGIVNEFILRRTSSLLSAHLPPKVVEVVCCRLTPLQHSLYCHFLESKAAASLFATQKAARVLGAITSLRKLLNHPKLIYDTIHSAARPEEGGAGPEGFEDAGRFFPPGLFDNGRPGRGGMPVGWECLSGKLAVLARMLEILRGGTRDRIVVVSNYTQTLDIVGQLCRDRGYPFLRLDGTTSINKRNKLVKRFNDPTENHFVFLLSSKAGGCGLNLIGGNRLVLFDPDWNPASDKQAAARVWRDGQKKKVYVYRFLAAGTIEEKVYQRQLSKEGLQQVVDSSKGGGRGGGALMSIEQLRDLFSYDGQALSSTYDSLCRCDANEDGPPAAAAAAPGRAAQQQQGQQQGETGAAADGGDNWESSSDDSSSSSSSSEGDDTEVLPDSEDEEEERQQKRGKHPRHGSSAASTKAGAADAAAEEAPEQRLPALPSSGAVVAAGGAIEKAQEGNPAEEDLLHWGHHSDTASVPDQVMQAIGNEYVSFVFSLQVDGRPTDPEPPLPIRPPSGSAASAPTGAAASRPAHHRHQQQQRQPPAPRQLHQGAGTSPAAKENASSNAAPRPPPASLPAPQQKQQQGSAAPPQLKRKPPEQGLAAAVKRAAAAAAAADSDDDFR